MTYVLIQLVGSFTNNRGIVLESINFLLGFLVLGAIQWIVLSQYFANLPARTWMIATIVGQLLATAILVPGILIVALVPTLRIILTDAPYSQLLIIAAGVILNTLTALRQWRVLQDYEHTGAKSAKQSWLIANGVAAVVGTGAYEIWRYLARTGREPTLSDLLVGAASAGLATILPGMVLRQLLAQAKPGPTGTTAGLSPTLGFTSAHYRASARKAKHSRRGRR
jgi:hypothetical protein